MKRDLYTLIEQALGAKASSSRPLSGGCVGEVYRLTLETGANLVAKIDTGQKPRLDIEGYMLTYLAQHSALPVPKVLHAAPQLLIMEFIEGTSSFNASAEIHAAELLAALHNIRGEYFGLERPTLIGGLHQPNTRSTSWLDFFGEQRVLFFAEEAVRERKMSSDFYKRLLKFCRDLPNFIEEPEYPSLLHGDVWTTNVLAHGDQITGFIDPAVYYGHPEIELAFITLFNTFGDTFFSRYNELRHIAPGFFETRRDIYNIYPLLVHTRLFGPSYLSGIDRTLRQHGY